MGYGWRLTVQYSRSPNNPTPILVLSPRYADELDAIES